ncbi:hypothetical protein KAW64_03570 [bacterium]|nr:hypothetical protein [bacterium]
MLKRILFVIHGMGDFDTDWAEAADGPITTLRDLSTQYRYFQDEHPIDDVIEFVPLTYDQIFRDIAERWRDGNGLRDLEPEFHDWISADAKDKVLDWLSDPEHANDFWWTHSADVLMYRLIPAYRNRVRAEVLRQMGEAIERASRPGKRPTCSVLAHSLGTAVAHDCIHLLGTQDWRDDSAPSPLAPQHWRFQTITMVANTSRLLEQANDQVPHPYKSIVRPGKKKTKDSYCSMFRNCRHVTDPVTWPLPFEPLAGWAEGRRFDKVVVDHYRSLDVHGLSHYLCNPRVHIPLLRLARSRAVTKEEAKRALDPQVFPQIVGSDDFKQKVQQLEAAFQHVAIDLGDVSSITDWLSTLVGFYETVRGEG